MFVIDIFAFQTNDYSNPHSLSAFTERKIGRLKIGKLVAGQSGKDGHSKLDQTDLTKDRSLTK